LHFLCTLPGEVPSAIRQGSPTSSQTGMGCVVSNIVGLFNSDSDDTAVAPLDGVACRRRHSSDLR
jgi:hypothetical protein